MEKDKEYYDDKGIRQESHISIFLCICASPVLNLDLPAKIDYIFELIHPSDADKNLKRAGTKDFAEKEFYDIRYSFPKCFTTKDIEEKGFIHSDGSLRIRLYIKKQNYQQKLALL